MFKYENKPTWIKLSSELVVAKWVIHGKDYLQALNPTKLKHTYGWFYEGN